MEEGVPGGTRADGGGSIEAGPPRVTMAVMPSIPTRLLLVLGAALAAAPAVVGQEASAEVGLTDRQKAAHLLDRLAFGGRPGDAERILEMGIDAWLDEQLQPYGPEGRRLEEAIADFETLEMDPARLWNWIRDGVGDPFARERDLSEEQQRRFRERRRQPVMELVQSTLYRAVLSDRRLDEVLADFWRNHLNVSLTKGNDIFPQLPDYERTVVRGHLHGTFPEMLMASAKHPAMLNSLDTAVSRRPPTKAELAEIENRARRRSGGSRERGEEARAIAEQRGLNENYARELMELHTLGVDNGYDQDDVVALAEALTGWTYDGGRNGTQLFRFQERMHVKGPKRIVGKTFREDRDGGPGQGEAVIEYLAHHRNTAEFIARKLVRYLVDDDPPESLVREVARVYRKTDGSIPDMVAAIVHSDEFWSPAHFQAKFKTPFEFVVSALRATDADVEDARALMRQLEEMGQPLHACDDPTGYYDTADAWLDPGVMALRWQFAVDLCEGRIPGVRIPDSFWDRIPADADPVTWQHHLVRLLLPEGAGERTRAALATLTTQYLEKTKRPDLYVLGPKLLAVVLGSPEFQKQ